MSRIASVKLKKALSDCKHAVSPRVLAFCVMVVCLVATLSVTAANLRLTYVTDSNGARQVILTSETDPAQVMNLSGIQSEEGDQVYYTAYSGNLAALNIERAFSVTRNIEKIEYPKEQKERLSVIYSVPKWIIEKWTKEYGISKTEEMLEGLYKPKATSVRCNTSKATVEEIVKSLEYQGTTVEKSKLYDKALKISGYDKLENLDVFKAGMVTVQDESSMMENYLLPERNIELAAEGKRWYDMIRYAKSKNYAHKSAFIALVQQYNTTANASWIRSVLQNEYAWYLPIHADEIENNNLLVQNPYYGITGNN